MGDPGSFTPGITSKRASRCAKNIYFWLKILKIFGLRPGTPGHHRFSVWPCKNAIKMCCKIFFIRFIYIASKLYTFLKKFIESNSFLLIYASVYHIFIVLLNTRKLKATRRYPQMNKAHLFLYVSTVAHILQLKKLQLRRHHGNI